MCQLLTAVANCQEVVAVVHPRNSENVYHSNSSTVRKCTSTALYMTHPVVA